MMITLSYRAANMKLSLEKVLKVLALAFVVASMGYVIYVAHVMTSIQKNSFAKTIIDGTVLVSNEEDIPSSSPVVANPSNPKPLLNDNKLPLDGISPADARDNLQWYTNKGHFSEGDLIAYNSYDDKTLGELISNNDTLATQVMGDRFFDRGDKERAVELYFLAAAQGSSGILLTLSHLTEQPFRSGETAAERKIIYRASVVESLAILKTMFIRGDIRMAALGMETQKKSYETLAKEPLVLSTDELTYIDRRGQEIYADLQHKRYELGLGDFDNSTSKVERLLYEFFY